MKNYFDCYDEFATESFDLLDQFVLMLYQKALATGMTKQEAKQAVKTFLINRMERRYINHLAEHAALCSFVFPGVERSEDIHV